MRRLLLFGLTLAMLVPVSVYALSLGNIELKSGLHQPLDARIPILSATGEEIDTLQVKVASAEEFTRAGVNYAGVLTQLKFEILQTSKGPDYIRISSRDPIREPFLNFLIEVNWAKGRLIREFTALLDPPLYDPSRRISWSPATVSPAPAKPPAPPPVADRRVAAAPPPPPGEPTRAAPSPRPTAREIPATAPTSAPLASTGGAYPTLWSAATSMRPGSSVSIQQMMIALLRTNPDAFIRGNINLLKKGYVLKMPEQGVLNAIARAEALAEVQKHHALWQEYRTRGAAAAPRQPQGAAVAAASTSTANDQSPAAAADYKDQLKLIAANTGAGAAGGASGKTAEELALTKESLESKNRENEELRSQLTESEQIIEKLKSRVALQDEQLADLQRKLAEAGGATAEAAGPEMVYTPSADAPSAEVTPVRPMPPESWRALESVVQTPVYPLPGAVPQEAAPEAVEQVAEPPVEAPVEEVAPVIEPTPPEEPIAAEPAPSEDTTATEPETTTAEDVTAPAESPAEPAPDATPPGAGIVGTLNNLLGGVIPKSLLEAVPGGALTLLGVLAAVLIGFIALLTRRRAAQAPASFPAVADTQDNAFDMALETASVGDTTDEMPVLEPAADDVLFQEPAKTEPTPSTVPMVDTKPGEATDEDPLAEVNVYLAYERFDEAERLIKEAIANYPHEHKYKLRLLEVYYSSNNRPAYEAAARDLHKAVNGSGPLWESAVAMWREMSPSRELFAAGDEPATMISTPASRQFVDITAGDDRISRTVTSAVAAGTGAGAVVNLMPSAAGADLQIPDLEGGLDFDLDSDDQEAFGMLDITAPTDSGPSDSGILDISAGGDQPDMGSLLEVSIPSAIEGASSAVNELLSLTKTGAVKSEDSDLAALMDASLDFGVSPLETTSGKRSGAATLSPDDMLDFDLGASSAGPDLKPADSNILDFPARQETAGTLPESLTTMVDIAPMPQAKPEEFDIGGLDLSLDADVPAKPDTAEQSLDLSLGNDGGAEVTVGDIDSLSLDEDTVRLFENDMAATGDQVTMPLFDTAGDAAATTEDFALTDELFGKESAGEEALALEGTDDVSLDDITKSLEETVGKRDEDDNGFDTVDLTLDAGSMSEIEETAELFDNGLRAGAEETLGAPQSPFAESQGGGDVDTKLNLAKAYIELGDAAGARSILDEVANEGSEMQREEARRLLRELTT